MCSYLFPSTFGVQAFMNMSTAGGGMWAAQEQMTAIVIQTIVYFITSYIAVYVENRLIHRRQALAEGSAKE